MGRKTFESLGRPLPGRKNIVLTRDKTLKLKDCSIFSSLDNALEFLNSKYDDESEAIIIGGASLFQEALPQVFRLYLTLIFKEYIGDTFFPTYNELEWDVIENRYFPAKEGSPAFSFKILNRKKRY